MAVPVSVGAGLFPPSNPGVGDSVASVEWEETLDIGRLISSCAGDMGTRNPVIVVATDGIASVRAATFTRPTFCITTIIESTASSSESKTHPDFVLAVVYAVRSPASVGRHHYT